MKQTWIIISLAAFCSVLITFFTFFTQDGSRVLLVRDAFDPTFELLKPYAEDKIELFNPYELPQQLPGLSGMAFVFSTQARPFASDHSRAGFTPLFTTEIVIAVNQNSELAGRIDGWRHLLDSEAVVLIPDNGVESGRLAAIALAKGLGAREGDLTPALNAFRQLEIQGRLNPRHEYASEEYRNTYQPHRPAAYDAVILWDYQARNLAREDGHWTIVVPTEGTVSVEVGFVYGGTAASMEALSPVQEYLLSDQGQQDFLSAGFSPFVESSSLEAWDRTRLLYNPQFRRTVRLDKLYAPASVRERLLLQSITFFLVCLAAQRIVRRVPRGQHRTLSITAILFVLFWMLTGTIKTIALSHDLTRYFWFASYIARHGLPVIWLCMCHMQAFNRLPSKRLIWTLGTSALVLTLFVLTNDLHHQIFIYTEADPRTWDRQYSNEWGFYLSLLWSFSILISGFLVLFREKITRQQKRRYSYAGIFLMLLILYQLSYLMGIERILDLDIPTTVAIMTMIFILSIQRERFMGALLMALPTLQNSPHAIAIDDYRGERVYRNPIMETMEKNACITNEIEKSAVIECNGKSFQTHVYPLENGKALIFENITDLQNLEQSMAKSQQKLAAIHKLLLYRTRMPSDLIGRIEQERYDCQIELLLNGQLAEAHRRLRCLADNEHEPNTRMLQQARFLILVCQQRLRLIIGSLHEGTMIPLSLLTRYLADVIKSSLRLGLDGVFVSATREGFLAPVNVQIILAAFDSICLLVLDLSDASLITRLEEDEQSVTLIVSITMDGATDQHNTKFHFDAIVEQLSQVNDRVEHLRGSDDVTIRLRISKEVAP